MSKRTTPRNDGNVSAVSEYDLLLAAIPLPLVAGLLAVAAGPLPMTAGVGSGSTLSLLLVVYALSVGAPVDAGPETGHVDGRGSHAD